MLWLPSGGTVNPHSATDGGREEFQLMVPTAQIVVTIRRVSIENLIDEADNVRVHRDRTKSTTSKPARERAPCATHCYPALLCHMLGGYSDDVKAVRCNTKVGTFEHYTVFESCICMLVNLFVQPAVINDVVGDTE